MTTRAHWTAMVLLAACETAPFALHGADSAQDGGPVMDADATTHDDGGVRIDGGPDGGDEVVHRDSGAADAGYASDASAQDAGRERDAGSPDAGWPHDAGPPLGPSCSLEFESSCPSDMPACREDTLTCAECRPGGPLQQCMGSVLRPLCSRLSYTCISRGNFCIELCARLSPSNTCIGNVVHGSTTVYERSCAFWLTLEPGSL